MDANLEIFWDFVGLLILLLLFILIVSVIAMNKLERLRKKPNEQEHLNNAIVWHIDQRHIAKKAEVQDEQYELQKMVNDLEKKK